MIVGSWNLFFIFLFLLLILWLCKYAYIHSFIIFNEFVLINYYVSNIMQGLTANKLMRRELQNFKVIKENVRNTSNEYTEWIYTTDLKWNFTLKTCSLYF